MDMACFCGYLCVRVDLKTKQNKKVVQRKRKTNSRTHKWLLWEKKLKHFVVGPPDLLTQHTTVSHCCRVPPVICNVSAVHQEFLDFPKSWTWQLFLTTLPKTKKERKKETNKKKKKKLKAAEFQGLWFLNASQDFHCLIVLLQRYSKTSYSFAMQPVQWSEDRRKNPTSPPKYFRSPSLVTPL